MCAYCERPGVWYIYKKLVCEAQECRELAEKEYNPSAHRSPSSCRGG